MACLQLRRASQWLSRFRRFDVLLDGERIDRIGDAGLRPGFPTDLRHGGCALGRNLRHALPQPLRGFARVRAFSLLIARAHDSVPQPPLAVDQHAADPIR